MKKHLSVFMLLARSTLYKAAGLFFIMSAACAALFYLAAERLDAPSTALERLFDDSRMGWAFGIFFILLTVLLCRSGCEYGGRQGYTLMRLSISERMVFLWQSVYNSLCYLLLWAAQALLAFGLCQAYLSAADPAYFSGQTLLLAFYRNQLLHALLPLEDTLGWVRNLILAVSLGIASAHYPYGQRRKKRRQEIFAAVWLVLVYFPRAVGDFISDWFAIMMALIAAGAAIYRVFDEDSSYEEAYQD